MVAVLFRPRPPGGGFSTLFFPRVLGGDKEMGREGGGVLFVVCIYWVGVKGLV